jgi:hypothetical protein
MGDLAMELCGKTGIGVVGGKRSRFKTHVEMEWKWQIK